MQHACPPFPSLLAFSSPSLPHYGCAWLCMAAHGCAWLCMDMVTLFCLPSAPSIVAHTRCAALERIDAICCMPSSPISSLQAPEQVSLPRAFNSLATHPLPHAVPICCEQCFLSTLRHLPGGWLPFLPGPHCPTLSHLPHAPPPLSLPACCLPDPSLSA